MSRRHFGQILAIALVISACTAGESSGGSSSTAGPSTSSLATPSTWDNVGGALARYKFEPGAVFSYEVSLDQHMVIAPDGEGASEPNGLPGSADIMIRGTGTMTQIVESGPDPGTYLITVTGEFASLDVSGTVDGESVDDMGEIPGLGTVAPLDSSFVVDEKGNIIAGQSEGDGLLDNPLFGGGDLSSFLPAINPARFLGPALPDEAVGVGDRWTAESELAGTGDEPTTVVTRSEVTGTESVGGSDALVVETTTATSPIEIDFGDFLGGLFGAIGGAESGEEGSEDDLRFVIQVGATEAVSVTWIHPGDGLVAWSEVAGRGVIGWDISLPGDEDDGPTTALVDMEMSQTLTYSLLEGGGPA